jgi:hypothetical protein
MRVCPFNKPQGWLHEATRALITLGSGAANQAILALDDASGFGAQADPKEFWEDKQDFIHIQNA